MPGSRVLRCVVATWVGAGVFAGGEALANSFCTLSGCQVRPPLSTPGYAHGSGGWGNDGNSGDPEREHRANWCMDFPHEVAKYGCDVYSPPQLQVNGCGTATGMPVPDFLVSPIMAVVAAGLGPIFSGACDLHDSCYGAPGANKQACDEALYRDMTTMGERRLPSALRASLKPMVQGQAWAYSRFLQWQAVAPWTSVPAFNAAQDEGYCRRWAGEFRQICQ